MLTRRTFLMTALLAPLACRSRAAELVRVVTAPRREARHYVKLGDGRGTVRCLLCPRRCTIPAGGSGFCRARRNDGGTLLALGYALPCALHVDPIEKKPFYNFYPGSRSFSLACAGCNLRCKYCQNWEISQRSPLETQNYPTPVATLPARTKERGARSIAFSYTEPTTFYEYLLDAARGARSQGILAVYHSNGFINPEPLRELSPHLDGANIDLKGFSDEFYRSVCEGELAPVLASLKMLREGNVWLEITNLVIPGYNDAPDTIRGMCRWIRSNLGAETPLHFSRFFPLYRMQTVPPTPVRSLERAREIARQEGLVYVYLGNVPGHDGNNTTCPKCRRVVIRRAGFSLLEMRMQGDRCGGCGARIAGRGYGTGGTGI